MNSTILSTGQGAVAPALAWGVREPLGKDLYDHAQMTPEKARVTCQIAWEVDAIARALPGMVPVGGSADAPFIARAVADRLCRLSEILVSVLSESTDDVQFLAVSAFLLDAASAEAVPESTREAV